MTELYEDYNQFRRLHPLTLLYGLFRNLPYILITLYLGLVQKQTEELFYIFMLIFLGMVIIPGHILRWYYFSYMIGENEIIIRSGVFARKTRNIPIKRVQNINVKQDVLQRILGIAKVQIETAGDISSEGSLDFVKLYEADEINKVIRLHKQKIIEKDNDIENIESNSDTISRSETFNPTLSGDTLFSMSGKDVLVYGMVRLRPLFLIYGAWAASFLTQFKYVSNIVSGYIEETVDSFADLPIELLLPLSVAFLILTVVMSWIVDIVWTFLQYYGFKLVKDGNKLVESYGLLSRNSVTIPLPKLQQITIATNPVKIKFNFYTLLLHTAGFDVYKKNASSGIPLAKKEDLLEIASEIYPVQIPESFRNISRKAVRRAFVRYLIFLIIPMAAAYYMIDWYFLSGLILIPLVYYGAVLRWQYRGYNISDNLIFVKHGFWNQKLNIIPVDKLQTLHVRASFFQRRLGLATVVIDTAASISAYDAVIPDIDADDAVMILEEINEAFLQKSRVIN